MKMNDIEEIEDEWENPYSVYTTAGLSYKAMRQELGKKKVTVNIPDEEAIKTPEESDVNLAASDTKPKKCPKSKANKIQLSDTSHKSAVATPIVQNDSCSVDKESLDDPGVRVTRSRRRQNKPSNTSSCESSNHVNRPVQPATARQGRRARNRRNNRNNNAVVLNAEPMDIPDSPTPLPVNSVQDEPVVLSDGSDIEMDKPVSKDLQLSLVEDDNYEISVRVWWKFGKIDKFNIRKYQKLESIFQHYAKQENVPEDNILLMLKTIKVQAYDSPDSIGLVPGMIIEGGVCGTSSTAASSMMGTESVADKNSIELRIQQKGKKVPLTLTINKTQKMQVLMFKCAEQLDLPVEKLKLHFDGEAVSAEETPEDLDLEGGECMDLHIVE